MRILHTHSASIWRRFKQTNAAFLCLNDENGKNLISTSVQPCELSLQTWSISIKTPLKSPKSYKLWGGIRAERLGGGVHLEDLTSPNRWETSWMRQVRASSFEWKFTRVWARYFNADTGEMIFITKAGMFGFTWNTVNYREGDSQLLIYTTFPVFFTLKSFTHSEATKKKRRVQNKVCGKNKDIHIYTNGSSSWDVQRVKTFSAPRVLVGRQFCNDTLQLSLGFSLGEVPQVVVLRGDSQQPGTGKHVNVSHRPRLFPYSMCLTAAGGGERGWHFKWICRVNVGHDTSWTETKELFHRSQKRKGPVWDAFQQSAMF